MCGIAGFIDFHKRSSENDLSSMSDTLVHRGPDGSGLFFEENGDFSLGLGHRRLSIIDLSDTGKQPMSYRNLHIVFNGEIYNYNEIKSELSKFGHRFNGHSDTEMILHAYETWGEKCLDRFIGMFSFTIFDRTKNELFCARDRAGVKPFFYYYHDGIFLFASELKAFHVHPRFKKELNISSAAAFLQHGNVPGPHCIFKNCLKLRPGHFLKLNLRSKNVLEEPYWNVYDSYNKPKLNIGFEEAKKETEHILSSAFRYRMVSDVPVGVFLSGGYDSTCLSAILQANGVGKLKTFTIGIKDSKLDEAPYAKQIAKYLGTEHHELYCDENDALNLIPMLPAVYDEPFGDQSAIPTMLVSKLAVRDVKVALSADGGDEAFGGYNRYGFLLKQGSWLNSIPSPLRNLASSIMGTVKAERIPYFGDTYNFANRYEKLKLLLRDPSPENFMLSLSKQYSQKELKKLLAINTEEPETLYNKKFLKNEFHTGLSYMMAIDYQTYLVDDILQKVDRATMAFSLEGREPFLDHRIIEFVARLPDSYKYNKGVKKYILREIVHKYIPKEMMDRPKMGFAIPIENWLDKDLKSLVLDHLSPSNLKSSGLLNQKQVEELLNGFFNGKKEFALKIWYLLMFQMWYKKWMV